MSDKYESAVLRYERARQLVNELDDKRRVLLSKCFNITKELDESSIPEGASASDIMQEIAEQSKICLVRAWDYMSSENKDCDIYGYAVCEYGEALRSEEVNACPACLEAYSLKCGDLAAAKQEFGAAKRSLSGLGKGLMKDE